MADAVAKGTLIGLLAGIFTGLLMLAFLFLYAALRPAVHMGSTAILGPLMGGCFSTVFGMMLGAGVGAIAGGTGYAVAGWLRGAMFGLAINGAVGIAMTAMAYVEGPQRAATDNFFTIGLMLLCPCLAGLAAGALVGGLGKSM